MAKKVVHDEYYIKITVKSRWHQSVDRDKKELEQLLQEIESKTKFLEGYDTEVASTDREICSLCENEWEEDENGMPCCCDEAREEITVDALTKPGTYGEIKNGSSNSGT